MEWVAAVILGAGVLPSLTALSLGLQSAIPAAYKLTGPINVLKLSAPLLLFFLWSARARLRPRLLGVLALAISIGTASVIAAGTPCRFPTGLLREWFVLCLGLVAALCVFVLPERKRVGVLAIWFAGIYGSAALEGLAPSAIDWLYARIFDPMTRDYDVSEVGRRVLTGVYGRQSMAKLLAWTPWLLIALAPRRVLLDRRWQLGLAGTAIASSALILATSQRGPLVGSLLGWSAFALYCGIRLKDWRAAGLTASAAIVSLSLTAALAPRDLVETRVRSLFGISNDTRFATIADGNRDFRLAMTRFSLRVIAEHPFGHACITTEEFTRAGITNYQHAHNLILQQLRSLGWAWGATHLALWLAALAGAWRRRSVEGAALAAGIVTVLGLGVFDHAWQVLNHAMMLWLFILSGLDPLLGQPSPATR